MQWSYTNDESKWCVKSFTCGYGLYKVVVSTESIFFNKCSYYFTHILHDVFQSFLVDDLVNLRQKLFLISKAQARGWLYSIEIVIISASELLDSLSQYLWRPYDNGSMKYTIVTILETSKISNFWYFWSIFWFIYIKNYDCWELHGYVTYEPQILHVYFGYYYQLS